MKPAVKNSTLILLIFKKWNISLGAQTKNFACDAVKHVDLFLETSLLALSHTIHLHHITLISASKVYSSK